MRTEVFGRAFIATPTVRRFGIVRGMLLCELLTAPLGRLTPMVGLRWLPLIFR
ncbi:hypothetical protein [Streptomyces sp. NPDC051704]|uniref:hypothetical protein n=1 Tax=Streptomyces sp. NPDC051704 TaxID=3365671 RepID=UPI00378DB2ED